MQIYNWNPESTEIPIFPLTSPVRFRIKGVWKAGKQKVKYHSEKNEDGTLSQLNSWNAINTINLQQWELSKPKVEEFNPLCVLHHFLTQRLGSSAGLNFFWTDLDIMINGQVNLTDIAATHRTGIVWMSVGLEVDRQQIIKMHYFALFLAKAVKQKSSYVCCCGCDYYCWSGEIFNLHS